MDIQSSFHYNDVLPIMHLDVSSSNNYSNSVEHSSSIEHSTSVEYSSSVKHSSSVEHFSSDNYKMSVDELKEEDINDNDNDNEQQDDILPISQIIYKLEEEQLDEKNQYDYHHNKNFGNWQYAKMIVSHSWQNTNATEFFYDYLEKILHDNNDCFDNIQTVYYKNDLDIDIIYNFEKEPAKHIVENLRICPFKPNGILFNNPEDTNKWSFQIVVITSNSFYSANRFINESLIGFF